MSDPLVNAGSVDPIPAAPVTAAPVVPLSPQIDPTGAAPIDWRSSLPETVRSWGEVTEAKSADQFWQDIGNMRGMVGQSVRVPSNEAGPEAWAAYAQKQNELAPGRFMVKPDRADPDQLAAYNLAIGVPGEAAGYNDIQNDSYAANEIEVAGAFKNIAHKNGLTPEQYTGFVSDYIDLLRHTDAETRAPYDKELATLKGEWGAAFDDRTGKAAGIMEKFGFPPIAIEAFKNGTADAQSMRAIYAMSEAIGTEGMNLTTQQTGNNSSALTPLEAEARINEIMAGADYNSNDPLIRKNAVMRMVELQKSASPETANVDLVFDGRR